MTHFPRHLLRPVITIALVASALGGLSACAPLLIGGAMVGGTMVYTDRRTSGTLIDDQAIELKAAKRIGELVGDRGNINVTSFNRIVLLTGEAPNEADKAAVEQAVQRIDNVRSVVNEVAMLAPSSLSSRSSDALLAGRVKGSFIEAKDLMANALKVVTERGTVYLMGRVTEREANRAAEVARAVSGAQRVVRVFEVISEAELANLAPASAPK